MHMCGITDQQNAAGPVGVGLPGVLAVDTAHRERTGSGRHFERHVDPEHSAQALPEFVIRQLARRILGQRTELEGAQHRRISVRLEEDHHTGVITVVPERNPPESGHIEPAVGGAELVGDAHVRQPGHRRRRVSGKADTRLLADGAAATVGTHQPIRFQHICAVGRGHIDGDTVRPGRQRGHGVSPTHLDP